MIWERFERNSESSQRAWMLRKAEMTNFNLEYLLMCPTVTLESSTESTAWILLH